MKSIIWLAWLTFATLTAFGQGTVNLANRVTGTLDAPVFDLDGTTKLSGTAYQAQLYGGPTAATLQPVGAPLYFRSGIGAGYLDPLSDPNGSTTRYITGVPPGATAALQLRAWQSSKGATYEAALANGGKTGASPVFTVVTGNAGVPPTLPAYLLGLQSFQLTLSGPPTIAKQPVAVVTGVGGTARFEVTASGPQPYRYQWRKGTSDLSGATGSVLLLQPVTAGDAGSYSVRVSNNFGFIDSSAVALTIVPAPVITAINITPNPPKVGQSLLLEAVVEGSGGLSFQWLLNGGNIVGATSPILQQAQAGAGTYSVKVTGPGGTTTRDAVTVSVDYILELVASAGGTVTASPSRASYAAGTRVTLTATAQSGYGFGGWSGDLTGTTSPVEIVMDGHKHIEAGFRPTGGTVVLANRATSLAIDAPVFDIDGTTKLEGSGFVAQLWAGPSAASLAPIGDPVPFRTGAAAGYVTSADRSIPTVPAGSLAYAQVRAWAVSAGATYEAAVAARGKAGASGIVTVTTGNAGTPPTLPAYLVGLQSFRLQVGAVPSIVKQPLPVNTGIGGTARFEVTAAGSAPLSYQWRKGVNPIPGATGPAYEIASVVAGDAGTYSVRVTNSLGFVDSDAVALSIVPAPTITQILVSPNPPVFGRALRLEAVATGTGPITYQWQLRQADIPNATGSVLALTSAEAGTYRVKVTGPGGSTFRDAVTVTAQYVLDLVTGNGGTVAVTPSQATYASGTTVTLTATPDAGYAFGGWSGDLTGTASPASLVMDAHKHVEASFKPTAGTVYFANRVLAMNLDAPVFDVDGTTRLAGTAFLAQLYGGPSADALVAVGDPVPFRTEEGAQGYFSPADRAIPGIAPGATAIVQVRAWVAADGATYEAALAKGGHVGSSLPFPVVTGNAGTPPTLPGYLTGLKSFHLESSVAPVIVKQPQPVNTGLGGSAHFEVVAAGTAPLVYQWRKGTDPIAGATGPAFDLASVVAGDAGSYSVRVTNRFGFAESAAVALTIVPAPTITEILISPNPPVFGRALRLEVKAAGTGPLAYQWQLQQADIPGATSAVLDVAAAAAGAYRVKVTGPGGSTLRDAATVAAQYTLQLVATDGGTATANPSQASYVEGATVTLTASPAPGYAFGGWSGDLSGTENPASVVMNGNKRVEASFRPTAGTVLFANRVIAASLDAPVFDVDGKTRLAGAAYLAQLYGGPAADRLTPVGAAVPFRSEPDAAGYFLPADRAIPGITPGAAAFVQIRAWRSADGDSYETALSNNGRVGSSTVFTAVTGNAGTPPTLPGYLTGLKSFSLTTGVVPSIVKQPAPVTTGIGGTARFEVVATGSAPLSYQWRKAGNPIQGAISSVLQIAPVAAGDAGMYWVRVTNRLGSVDSVAVELAIVPAPTITGIAVSSSPTMGRPLQLVATVNGVGSLTYEWLLDGVVIPNATGSTYEVASAAVGTYRLRVTGPGGQATRDAVTILALFPLERMAGRGGAIIADPVRDLYPTGAVVTLTARAEPGYAFGGWSGDLTGSDNPATLKMDAAKHVEAGFRPTGGTVYFANRVTGEAIDAPVFDTNGTTRLSGPGFLVQLYAGPAEDALQPAGPAVPFLSPPADGYFGGEDRSLPNVPPGGVAFVQLRAWATDAGATYEAALAAHGRTGTSTVLRIVTGNVGTPPSLPAYLTGLTSFRLQTGSPPRILTAPAALTVVKGQPARFTVSADGFPAPQFEWRMNGTAISGATAAAFEIATAQPTDAGLYSVRVYNSAGETNSVPVALAVLEPPVITSQTASTSLFVGESIRLSVTPGGTPPFTYEWFEGPVGDGAEAQGVHAASFLTPELTASTVYWVRVQNAAGRIDSAPIVLTVNRRTQTITFGPLAATRFGSAPVALSAQASSQLPVSFSVVSGPGVLADGKVTLTGAGTIKLRATQPGDARYLAAQPVDADLVVTPAPATVSLTGLEQNFDGTQKAVGTTVNPAGLVVRVTYGGSATPPSAIGDYAVVARVDDPNYEGSTTGTLHIRSIVNVAGTVFGDTDGNGQAGSAESGLAGVRIRLLASDAATEIQRTTTDDQGAYSFRGVAIGSYYLVEDNPAGYTSTTPDQRLIAVNGVDVTEVLFGDQPVGTVTGFVFDDRDGNGERGEGEAGIGGVQIRLTGSSGQRSTTTSAAGEFAFTDVSTGSYSVEEIDPAGYFSTTPSLRTVSVAAGGAASASFGDQAAGTVSGTVFEDLNGNGTPDAGEPGLRGVTIRLSGVGGQKTTTTSDAGTFTFSGILPGAYTLEETDLVGYFSTTPNSRTVSVPSGGAASATFGDQAAGSISGVVYDDLNGNSQREAGEPGLAHVAIKLVGAAGQRLAETDDDGTYRFTGIEPGPYQIEETDPTGFGSTTPNVRNLSVGSGGAASASFGDQAAASIAGLVFADTNGNGVRDAGESGLGGVAIRLVGTDGQRSTTTSGDGSFRFAALTPGTYSVEEIDPVDFASTTPNVRAVVLTSGAAASTSFGDQPVETISGLVFEDQNGNGQPDFGEPGVGGVKVLLLRADDSSQVAETLTSGNGEYVFASVPAGNYVVRQDVPDNYTVLVRTSPTVPALHSSGAAPDYVDRAVRLEEGGAAAASFGINVAGQLSGTVFHDLDGNGLPAAGEPGLGGARVEVTRTDTGAVVASTTSSGTGVYVVPKLSPGTYRVTQLPLTGYSSTPAPVTVTLVAGGAATANFANRADGSVSGRVFNDENGNGTRDGTEPGLGGIRITLQRTGNDPATTLTSSDGSFLFSGVTPGEIRLEATVPPAFHATTTTPLLLTLESGGALGARFGLRSDTVKPPTLTAEPADLVLAAGATATFEVVADGTAPLAYQWLKNSSPLPGQTQSRLTLTGVQAADEGLYQVRVSNPVGTVFSRNARLTIGTADPFTAWIGSQGVPAGLRRIQDDPDKDGLANLLEFVLGTPPGTPTTTGLPAVALTGTGDARHLGFELHRATAAVAVRLFLETSDDLASWQEIPATITVLATDATGDRVRVVDANPVGTNSHRFLRLGIALGSPLATPARLRLVSAPPIATSFRLALEGQAGATYAIERSDDLKNWSLLRNVTAEATAVIVTDAEVTGVPLRFYRAVAR